jgi:RNA polymerase subunit RPABC4/transcription elongation factor Spt4
MANVKIPCQPELTAAQAMTIFAERFRGKYKVSEDRQTKRQFVVKKSRTTAVSIRLQQEPEATKFIVTGCKSSPLPWIIGGLVALAIPLSWKYLGLLGVLSAVTIGVGVEAGLDLLLFGKGRNALEGEVVAFVENAGALWAQGSPALPSPGAVMPSAPVRVQPAFCTSCGAPLPGQARFCQVCGTPVPVLDPERRPSCAACGFLLGENTRFCQACGAPVPVPEPERLATASPALEQGTHCARCGTLAPQSSLFCHKCGAEVASAKRGNVQIIGAASNPAPEAAIRRGYCQRCGQELGVDEKMRGLTVHKRCAMSAFEAPASTPTTDTAGARGSGATAPTAPDAAVGGPSPTRGYCGVCGQELGVNEKIRGLTRHERCAMPAFEAPAAAPAQTSQMYCSECGTSIPASSRFCHKCGSAVAAAE